MKLKGNSSLLPLLFGIFFLTFQTGESSKKTKFTAKKVYVSDDEYQNDDIAKDKPAEYKDKDIPSGETNKPQNNIGKAEPGTNEGKSIPPGPKRPRLAMRCNLVASHLVPKDDKNLNERRACEGGSQSGDDIDINKIYDVNPSEEPFGSLYDAEIFVNDFDNYEAFSEPYEFVTSTYGETGGPYKLLDIASEIAKLETSRGDPKLVKKLRETLQKDLSDFLCKNPPKQRLPYGKALVFQDADDDKWYGLVTSGLRKKWTLLKPEGDQVDGDVSIEKSPKTRIDEIVFRCWKPHHLLKSTDWTFITPQTRTAIKDIRSFKKHIGTSCEDLKKFKRAAYIEEKKCEWEFQGFYEIESEIEYDATSTMHRIKWKDQSTKDTLKHESDLLAGDLEIGDVVIFDQDIAEDVGFGSVKEKLANGYKVKQEDDLNEDMLFLESDKIYLWKKRKPTEEETNVKHTDMLNMASRSFDANVENVQILQPSDHSKTYEPRAQFSISLRDIEEQNNHLVSYRKERNVDFAIGENEDGKDCYKRKSDDGIEIEEQKEINADIERNDEELSNEFEKSKSKESEKVEIEDHSSEDGNKRKREREYKK